MHASVMDFSVRSLQGPDILGKRVLEVGSYNVNGSVRDHVMRLAPASYVGVDMRPGPGVSQVCAAGDLQKEFGDEAFDVLISTEMLEHAQDWRGAIDNMKRVLKRGGLLLMTARGPGFPLHDFPGDFWRFTVEDVAKIFADFQILTLEADSDLQSPGFFLKALRTDAPLLDLSGISVAPVPTR